MSELRHTRKEPPEWEGLLRYSEQLVGKQRLRAAQAPSFGAAFRLAQRAGKLPFEQLEAAGYYAAGEAMMPLARRLREDSARQQFVRVTARALLENAVRRRAKDISATRPFVPVYNDFIGPVVRTRIAQLIEPTLGKLPHTTRLIAETLPGITAFRRCLPAPISRSRILASYAAASTRANIPLAEHLADALFAGTSIVLNRSHVVPLSVKSVRPGEEPVAVTDMSATSESLPYIQTACLRLDEFLSGHGYTTHENGNTFNARVLREDPGPTNFANLESPRFRRYHEARLVCPAVQAGGLAAHVGRVLLPEVIAAAYQLVPGEVFSGL